MWQSGFCGGNNLLDFYKACQGMISVSLQGAAKNLLRV